MTLQTPIPSAPCQRTPSQFPVPKTPAPVNVHNLRAQPPHPVCVFASHVGFSMSLVQVLWPFSVALAPKGPQCHGPCLLFENSLSTSEHNIGIMVNASILHSSHPCVTGGWGHLVINNRPANSAQWHEHITNPTYCEYAMLNSARV